MRHDEKAVDDHSDNDEDNTASEVDLVHNDGADWYLSSSSSFLTNSSD